MALSLAELLQWPDHIKDVADAAVARAKASQTAGQELAELSEISTWEGEAGDAARQATQDHKTTMEASGLDALAVAAGVNKAHQDSLEVVKQINALLEEAAQPPAVTVNLDTDEVIPPDTAGMSKSEVESLKKRMSSIIAAVEKSLAAGEQTDMELANVLKAATGEQGTDYQAAGKEDGQALASGTMTPEELTRLRKETALTPEQQAALQRGDLTIPARRCNTSTRYHARWMARAPPKFEQLCPRWDRMADTWPMRSNWSPTPTSRPRSPSPANSPTPPLRGAWTTCHPESGRHWTSIHSTGSTRSRSWACTPGPIPNSACLLRSSKRETRRYSKAPRSIQSC